MIRLRFSAFLLLALGGLGLAAPASASDADPDGAKPEPVRLLVSSNLGEACSAMGWREGSALLAAEWDKALEQARPGGPESQPLLVDLGGFAAPELPEGVGALGAAMLETPFNFGASPLFGRGQWAAVAVGLRDASLGQGGMDRLGVPRPGKTPPPLLGGLRTPDNFAAWGGGIARSVEGPPAVRFEALGATPPSALFGDMLDGFEPSAPGTLFEGAGEGEIRVLLAEALPGTELLPAGLAGAAAILVRGSGEPGVRVREGGVVEFGRGPLIASATLTPPAEEGAPWSVEASELWRFEGAAPCSVAFRAGDFRGQDLARALGEEEIGSVSIAPRYLEPEFESVFGEEGVSVAELSLGEPPAWHYLARLDVTYSKAPAWSIWLKVRDGGEGLEFIGDGSIAFGGRQVSAQRIADLLAAAAAEGRLDQPLEGEGLLGGALAKLRLGAKAFLSLF